MPNSNEVLQRFQVKGVRPNIFSADKTTNFTMTTITKDQKSRLLQGDQADDPTVAVVILRFEFPGEGVTILAASADDLMVQVDMDEMLGSY
jgi:acid phosphatase class B